MTLYSWWNIPPRVVKQLWYLQRWLPWMCGKLFEISEHQEWEHSIQIALTKHFLTLECFTCNFSTTRYVCTSCVCVFIILPPTKWQRPQDLKGHCVSNAQQPAITGLSLFLQVYHVLPTATTAHACLHAQHPAMTWPAPLSANHLVLKAVNVSLAMFLVVLTACLTNNVAAHTLTNIMRYSFSVGQTTPTAPNNIFFC